MDKLVIESQDVFLRFISKALSDEPSAQYSVDDILDVMENLIDTDILCNGGATVNQMRMWLFERRPQLTQLYKECVRGCESATLMRDFISWRISCYSVQESSDSEQRPSSGYQSIASLTDSSSSPSQFTYRSLPRLSLPSKQVSLLSSMIKGSSSESPKKTSFFSNGEVNSIDASHKLMAQFHTPGQRKSKRLVSSGSSSPAGGSYCKQLQLLAQYDVINRETDTLVWDRESNQPFALVTGCTPDISAKGDSYFGEN